MRSDRNDLWCSRKNPFFNCALSTAVHSWSWHCNVTLLKPRLLFFVLRSRASTCTLASPAPLCACGKFIVYNCCKSIAASFRRWILLKCSIYDFFPVFRNPRFFSKTKCLYLRDALMDFDIPKAGHVFDTSSSKLPVDFLGSEQIPGSNFHDLDFSIFRIFFSRFFRNRKIPKSKSWKFDTAIWSDREKKLQALKNSFRKRVQPSGYQNPCTHLGVTRVRKSWLIAIFMIENLDFVMAVWKQIT